MSSSFLLTNTFPPDTMTNSLDHHRCFMASLHCKRSTPISPTIVRGQSSSPFISKNFPGSSGLLSCRSYTSNRRNNSKLWAASSEDKKQTSSGPSLEPRRVSRQIEVATELDDEAMDKVEAFIDVMWRFLRPFVFKRTIITLIAMAARVWIANPHLIRWNTLPLKSVAAVFIGFCCSWFIEGINQIHDVDIDKINKPYLPIPSGDMSLRSAWGIVKFSGIVGLLLVIMNESGPLITLLYFLTLLVGYVYSAPPFRLKRFAPAVLLVMLALMCLFNVGIYTACRASIGLAFEWNPALSYIIIMAIMYGAAFALVKDLPDIEGDSKFGVDTFAIRHGVRKIVFLSTGIILLTHMAAIITAILVPQAGFKLGVFIPTNVIMALCLIYKARELLAQANYSKEANYKFYIFLWNLKYAEIMLFPFI